MGRRKKCEQEWQKGPGTEGGEMYENEDKENKKNKVTD